MILPTVLDAAAGIAMAAHPIDAGILTLCAEVRPLGAGEQLWLVRLDTGARSTLPKPISIR